MQLTSQLLSVVSPSVNEVRLASCVLTRQEGPQRQCLFVLDLRNTSGHISVRDHHTVSTPQQHIKTEG